MLSASHAAVGSDAAPAAATEDPGKEVVEGEVKAKVAKALPEVHEPTPAEVAQHCLTHRPCKNVV